MQDAKHASQMGSLEASQKTPGFTEVADHLMLMGFDNGYLLRLLIFCVKVLLRNCKQ